MLVVYGTYFFARRKVAFRNDYCLNCAAPRLAVRQRSIDVAHVFWLPILPLGIWKRWLCSVCGKDPHLQVRTSKGIKWAGVGLLIFFALSTWAAKAEGSSEDIAITWLMRIGLPIGVFFAIRGAMRSPEPESLKESLRAVAPYREHQCPLCRGSLQGRPSGWSCGSCGALRMDARAA
jgi:hypothetical protein